MNSFALLALSYPLAIPILAAIFGLLVGSFLNVVIYRLPVMMHRSWRQECQQYLQIESTASAEPPFNLVLPLSRCPHCSSPIKPYQNIPVISYIFLNGKCAQCKAPISIRYPVIEALSALMSAAVAWHFGYSVATLFALLLTWSLIALCFIDIDQQLLPDNITLPLLWLGLILSLFGVFTDSRASIIGAAAGYLSLRSVYQLFKWLTGKEGMGFGDFKLLAALGAWLGWQSLPLIIVLSSLVGTVVGISMVIFVKHDHTKPIPFGPYLAAAGWLALIWGHSLNQFYLSASGL
ncbi:MAG: A24 family peptidase [Methylococcaceae bacterium]|jgi:leader peptidase (prepilin peptidase)/N-methyltransferase